MLVSLYKTAWTAGAGLAATVFLAGAAYYLEARDLEMASRQAADQQIDLVERSLRGARTESYAAGALIGGGSPTISVVSDFLTRLAGPRETDARWIWARVIPAGDVMSLEKDIQAESGNADYRVHGLPAESPFAAPVIFMSGKQPPGVLGLDLGGITSMSGVLKEEGKQSEFVISAKDGPLDEPALLIGVRTANLTPGTETVSRNLLFKAIPYSDLLRGASLMPDQSFVLSEINNGQSTSLYTAGPQLTADPSLVQRRSMSIGPYALGVSLTPSNDGPGPRSWLIVALAGILATGLAWVARAWANLGGRANTLSHELSYTAAELSTVRVRQEAFFENSGTANCEADVTNGRILRANDEMASLLGYTPEELETKTVAGLTHPDDIARSAALLRGGDGTPREQVQFETRFIRKDGKPVWCLVNGKLIESQPGEPAAYAIVVIDISKRKQDEETQSMLLSELAHRVRNSVQLTSSLARQSASTARSVEDYERKFHGRLMALKAAQDLLFDTGWTFASLQALAQSTLRPYMPLQDDLARIRIDLPHVELPTQHAQTLGIAFNELGANSARHGALAHGGTVSLSGRLEREDAGALLYLRWEESGLRNVRPPRRSGFGLTMLEKAVPDQFQGRAKLSWQRTGLIYEAWLPINAITS
ncbi:sensor histidine kinase [Aestuariivirga sp.]|uniref:sensor histidine kinase n=1 Tax=Aestuariivirga sp. TaxID=2650926 RepID=UPI0039E370F4